MEAVPNRPIISDIAQSQSNTKGKLLTRLGIKTNITQNPPTSKQTINISIIFQRFRTAMGTKVESFKTWSHNIKTPSKILAMRTSQAAATVSVVPESANRIARPLPMSANQERAVDEMRTHAKQRSQEATPELTEKLKAVGYSDEDIELIRMAFRRSEITINISPEKLVGMVEEGSLKYKTLFENMYSKGANDPEGRMKAEQELFPEYRWKKHHNVNEHPKYGTVSPIPFHAGGATWYGAVALILHEDANVTNTTMTSYDSLNESHQVAGTPDAVDHVLLERINRTEDALRDYGNGVKGDVRAELDLVLQYARRAYAKPTMSETQTETPQAPTLTNDSEFTQFRMHGPINKYYEAQVHTTNLMLSTENVRAVRIDFDKIKDKAQLQPVIDFCIQNKIPIVWGCEDNRYFVDPRIPPQNSPNTETGEYYKQLQQAGAKVDSMNDTNKAVRDNFAKLFAEGKSFTEIYDALPPAFKDNLRGVNGPA